MKGINLITTKINHHFVENVFKCSDKLAGSIFFAVVQSASRGDQPGSFPVIFDEQGRGQYIGIDQVNPFMMYHRIGSINFTPNPRASFGDGTAQNLIIGMRAAVYHDRARIPATSDEMGMFMCNGFPNEIKNVPNFGNVRVRFNSIIPDTNAAFAMEYPATPYFMKPEHSLIIINYQLETQVKPGCFNHCID